MQSDVVGAWQVAAITAERDQIRAERDTLSVKVQLHEHAMSAATAGANAGIKDAERRVAELKVQVESLRYS